MIYLIINNGVYVQHVNDADGNFAWDENNFCTPSALTPAQMEQYGVVPFALTVQPTFNALTQTCAEAPPVQVAGVWTQQWAVSPLPLATAQANLLAQLEPQRIIQQSAGLPYTFPDGTVGTIQTRDPSIYSDILNVNSYALMATVAAAQGGTTMTPGFTDASNVTHSMTPAQAVAMGVAVSTFVGRLYAAKQTIRTAINALTEATITTFDITKGWTT
ncbi:MAG: DUF4376 domain-containing protein [Burkholderiaceae bacterium]|nr:DUF4376 domain-containing protein [Burkholderiaceae bacterium]